ncbi:pentatricopeptide repeat-containing protein At3g23020 [Cornus florida]|uniref:pentatricopeptide repeat-containing protein At3g23020 n=1 Tax=Cornus florida TaxID=4283 RepID=UPI00289E9525|nr:pentatricopeptide repeat-containing protein At3g23020 [Cornus florida]
MFVKLQQIDTNCFHALSSMKTTTNIGVTLSPPDKVEPIKKNKAQQVLETPNGGVKRFGKVYRQPHDRIHKSDSDQHGLVKIPSREHGRNIWGNGGIEKKRDFVEKIGPGNRNGVMGKVHTKCSMKWVRYGGCVPAILEALETVSDLDEALRPWEESLTNKERSIILKEQSSWERALQIFEWFKRKGCYELNVIHYNIMLRILGKARRWGLVESLWDEMGKRSIVPINSTYGTLIDVYSKGGLKEAALHWLELMNKQGMEPDEVTMGIVVQTYKKAGEFEKAEQFFKKWSSGISSTGDGRTITPTTSVIVNGDSQPHVHLSSYTYNTLIDTFGKAGQLKEASETFSRMLRDGIVPNTVTFNTMIHICGNYGQLEEVVSLMHKMEELRCAPDTRTYNILISLHAKHDDIKMAAKYLTEMKEASLEPDLVSYRTLLYAFSIRHMVCEAEELVSEMDRRGLEIDEFTQSALTRMYIEAGMLEKSWLWFKRFHLEGNMSSECYSANIDAFGERGHVLEAEKVFISCQEGKKLTVVEFNVMVKAYGISKRYEKACQLFDNMEKHDVVPDKCSYNSLIQLLATAELPHLALPYVRKMQEAGLVSDCIPYCAVISSFVKLGQLDMAEGVFTEMVRFNVQPDVVVFGVLINAFADIGCVKEALRYVDAMRDAGISMNAVIYNSLIKLYTKVGYLNEAQETYKMLQAFEMGPDLYSSNCMIDLYTERSMVKEAENIFENLKRKGDANEFSYAMMLCMYKRIGMFKEAVHIAQKMKELGLLTDLLSYNHVLGLYALYGRFREAVGTFKEMMSSTIQPDDSTFKSLGVVLVKCGVPKQAVGKLEATRKKDTKAGLQTWVSTLDSVVGVDIDDVDVSNA